MKDSGKKFEDLISLSSKEQGWDITRLHDTGGFGSRDVQRRRFTLKNICDFVMFKDGHIFYTEAKSSKGRLAFSRLTQHKALMKKHAEGIENVHAGYLLEVDSVVSYVSVFDMEMLMRDIGKKSANVSDLKRFELGMITPKGKKKQRIDLSGLPINFNYS